jgi:hypothetical protein
VESGLISLEESLLVPLGHVVVHMRLLSTHRANSAGFLSVARIEYLQASSSGFFAAL